MIESFDYFPPRKTYRAAWIGLQVVILIPWMVFGALSIEMTFAEPNKGYVTSSGKYVSCEALAPRSRTTSPYRCAFLGSKETNPTGFGWVLASFAVLNGMMWISSRPGRGLTFSK
jgi:hypothetical protein